MRHYDLKGQKIQTGKANENGDIEQRHHRLKRAVEQALFLRSISDFSTRKEYEAFLRKLFSQLNAGRQEQFKEKLKVLKSLPAMRLDDYTVSKVKVDSGSTVRIVIAFKMYG